MFDIISDVLTSFSIATGNREDYTCETMRSLLVTGLAESDRIMQIYLQLIIDL